MRLILIPLLVLWTSVGSALAQSLACGIPPIPPIGCRSPHCVCDVYGHCQWVFDC
jgi:hypothetical protein